MDIPTLAIATAERLPGVTDRPALVGRIRQLVSAQRGAGAKELSGDWLLMASTVVHVCSMVFEVANTSAKFREMKKAEQLEQVLLALAAKTGDPEAGTKEKVKMVVSDALDVLSEQQESE
jgi:hypothetical protein